MAGEIINIESLNQFTVKYNAVLRELPYDGFDEKLAELMVNRLEVKGELKDKLFKRKGGLSAPYVKKAFDENPAYVSEIGKVEENSLKPDKCFLPLVDHVDNLRAKVISGNNPDAAVASNISKDHPQKALIMKTIIATISEDNLSAIFPAQRDEDDASPLGMFDGFDKKIADYITAGKISAGNKNLILTGAITSSNGFSKLVAFIRSLNAKLREKGILYISFSSYFKCLDSLTASLQTSTLIKQQDFIDYVLSQSGAPNLKIIISDVFGSGDNWTATLPWNFECGMNTEGEEQFVEVRRPFQDPGYYQFWSQWELGTRVVEYHPKALSVNDQLPIAGELRGDYIS